LIDKAWELNSFLPRLCLEVAGNPSRGDRMGNYHPTFFRSTLFPTTLAHGMGDSDSYGITELYPSTSPDVISGELLTLL
jgi:hypothetical protein